MNSEVKATPTPQHRPNRAPISHPPVRCAQKPEPGSQAHAPDVGFEIGAAAERRDRRRIKSTASRGSSEVNIEIFGLHAPVMPQGGLDASPDGIAGLDRIDL